MEKRTNFSDVVVMALLFYHDSNSLTTMISYEKVNKFDEVINQNLNKMNSNITSTFSNEEESKLYFRAIDEDGKIYFVINPNADIESVKYYYLGLLPLAILLAATMNNALATIGLKLVDGNFKKN